MRRIMPYFVVVTFALVCLAQIHLRSERAGKPEQTVTMKQAGTSRLAPITPNVVSKARSARRPNHMSESRSTDRSTVIYGNTMTKRKGGPWVYGLSRHHSVQTGRHGRDGSHMISRTEYGRPAGRR